MKKLRDKSNKNRNHAVDLRIGNIKSTFDGIIVKAFGDMKPNSVNEMEISEWLVSLQEELVLSSQTVHIIYSIMNMIFADAFRNRLIDMNPCEVAWHPKVEHKPSKSLTKEQYQKLCAYVIDKKYGFEVIMLLATGMRKGELLGLKECDIDWEGRQIHVQRQITQDKGSDGKQHYMEKQKLKTAKSNRYISVR